MGIMHLIKVFNKS